MSKRLWVGRRLLVLCVALTSNTALADVWGDVGLGLDYAGFQFTGQRNPLSQGLTLQTARNFQNTPLDFGTTDLVLTGPVAAQVTTANRGIRSLEFSFVAGTPTNPLLYNLQTDVGSTQVRLDGSTVFNVNGSINQFGWYDMQFQWSNRQTSSSDGRFANLEDELSDFDIGPINVSGNIFADLLASATDPLFEASGYENIFATFSGRTARENALESTVARLEEKAAAGLTLSRREVADLVRLAAESEVHGDDLPDMDFLADAHIRGGNADQGRVRAAIPEPATLLLLAVPVVLLRRRRR